MIEDYTTGNKGTTKKINIFFKIETLGFDPHALFP
jgi:hypothetical protein